MSMLRSWFLNVVYEFKTLKRNTTNRVVSSQAPAIGIQSSHSLLKYNLVLCTKFALYYLIYI